MSDRQNRATVADVRRAAIDAIYYVTYQMEAEAELGDGPDSEAWKARDAEQSLLLEVLFKLMTTEEVLDCLAHAQRYASSRVNGD